MSNLFTKVFGKCTNRERMAEEAMQVRAKEHDHIMDEMNAHIKEAKRTAVQNKSAARTLLKRLSEDIPK